MALETASSDPQNCHMATLMLRELRENARLTLEDLAGDIDISVSQLSRIERGQREVRLDELSRIAKRLHVTIGDIVGESERDTVYVPLLERISAGTFRANDGVREADIERHIKVSHLPKGDWFALTVDGDSMNRIAPDGSIIIVNRADDRLMDGAYYVFSLNNGDTTFKRFRRDPEPMLTPFSWNPDHYTIPVGNHELYVFGRVRRVITDL